MVERVSREDTKPAPDDPDLPAASSGSATDAPERRSQTAADRDEADAITFEQIRERAYELWERNHRPDGFEIQFWLLAERELRAERERRRGDPRVGSEEGVPEAPDP